MTTTSDGTETILRPGRLGDPERNLRTDPRTDPRTVEALAPFGLDVNGAPAPIGPDSPREQQLEFALGAEAGFEAVFAALMDGLEPVEGLEHRTETITGPAGNEIQLYVTRPADLTGPLPGILHIHGGGMVLLRPPVPPTSGSRDELASSGMVVVGVEFRNGGGKHGAYPFPAGLNDCPSALRPG